MKISKKKIKETILLLSKNKIIKPKFEFEIANTYPVSIIPCWPKLKKEKVLLGAFKQIPKLIGPKMYFHIPFCTKKCKYCFYYSKAGYNEIDKYLDYLKREIIKVKSILHKKKIMADSFYFGGGTPSILSPKQLNDFFEFILHEFKLNKNYSWTFEVSPETISDEKLKILKKFGVNRISMGVQSFEDKILQKMGRAHNNETALKAILKIKNENFSIFNIDLIYGFPYQTNHSWEETINKTINLQIPELTLYHLRINAYINIKKDKNYWLRETNMLNNASHILRKAGYIQVRPHHWILKKYFKAWSRYKSAPTSDQRAKKKGGFVLAFGPSAIGHLGDFIYFDVDDINEYFNQLDDNKFPVDRYFTIKKEDKISRFLITKLIQGLSLNLNNFKKEFGFQIPVNYNKILEKFERLGLIEKNNEILKMTQIGLLFFDQMERALYPKRILKLCQKK